MSNRDAGGGEILGSRAHPSHRSFMALIDRIDHFVLTVRDVSAASAWYQRVLGMEVVESAAGRVSLRFGSQKINLHPAGAEFRPHALAPTPGSGDFCLIAGEPLAGVAARLSAHGVPIEVGPVEKLGALGPVDSVYFRDPDQNLVEVSTYRATVDARDTHATVDRTSARAVTVYQVDAFTKHRFTGNPAGVVLDASGLSDAEMQGIALELGNSETAFLFPPSARDHDVRIRYFTPKAEVPLCGHATIAAHYTRAVVGRLPAGTVVQRGLAGDLPVELTQERGDYQVTLTLATPVFEAPLADALVSRICSALGIGAGDLLPNAPVQVVGAGHSKVMVGLGRRETLMRLEPDMAALTALSREVGSNGYHVFTFDTGEPGVLTSCRMFAPAIGVPEDPVTGNGNGPLGAYLVRHGLVPHDGRRLTFCSTQGASVSRRGVVHVDVDIEGDQPRRVRIGRDAVIVFRAELYL